MPIQQQSRPYQRSEKAYLAEHALDSGLTVGPQAPVMPNDVPEAQGGLIPPEALPPAGAPNVAPQPEINLQPPPINPLEAIISQSELAGFNNISLKTLKKAEKEKIMKAIKKCKKIANDYYTGTVQPAVKAREEIYDSSEALYLRKFPALSEQSKWRSRDVKTVIDWIMPNLLESFTGSDDPASIKGVDMKDDEAAKKIQQLIKYQLERKNNYYSFLVYILTEALKTNLGVAKVFWKREEKRDTYTLMWDINDLATFNSLQEEVSKGHIELQDVKPIEGAPDLYKITFESIKVLSNFPQVEYLPPSELRFTPEATCLQKCKFVAHRKIVQGDYLKQEENKGVFENVDEAIEAAGNTEPTSNEVRRNNTLSNVRKELSDSDNASKDIELYECYIKVDYNNDGVLEDLIVHCVEDVPISIQLNEMKFIPFFLSCGVYDPCMIFPKEGYTDGLEQLQDLKTALIRQTIIAVAKNNIPQKYVNITDMDMDAIIAGEEVVPYSGKGAPQDAIFIPPAINLSPLTMELVQYAQSEIESQSGSTKYNQGTDSNTLNKTATGITAILGQADKRIKMLAKQISENFLIPMFKYVILLNQRYAEQEQIVRLTNENLIIDKKDLDIDYDFIINVGEGAGTKQAQITALMMLFSQLVPVLESKGLATPNSYYSIYRDILAEMGLRNTTNYVIDPNSQEGKQMAAELAKQAQQAQQQQLEMLKAKAQMDIEKAKAPKLSVSYNDLPTEAKEALLKQNGIPASASNIGTQEVINHA